MIKTREIRTTKHRQKVECSFYSKKPSFFNFQNLKKAYFFNKSYIKKDEKNKIEFLH